MASSRLQHAVSPPTQPGCAVCIPAQFGGLHLLVDSTGIKFLGECEWKCKEHGPERRRQWRKLHIGIDAQTLQVRAICVTSNNATDAAVLPQLLEQVPAQEPLLNVTGDWAYNTQHVHTAVMLRNVTPIIPQERMPGCAKAMPVRTVMRRLPHAGASVENSGKAGGGYHQRSLVETKMHCIKRLGERIMSRTFERQVNEMHIRAATLNRFTELGCPHKVAVT